MHVLPVLTLCAGDAHMSRFLRRGVSATRLSMDEERLGEGGNLAIGSEVRTKSPGVSF